MTAVPGLIQADWFDGYDLGVGVNSFDGKARGRVIQSSDITTETAGFDTDLSINFATSKQEFFKSLGISTDVSASYGLASVSTKMDFAQKFTSSQFSSWMVVRCAVTHLRKKLKEPSLSQAAADALMKDGSLKFFQSYGDLFVLEADLGAELVAALEIVSTSEEAQQELKASWDLAYSGGISASTKGEIENVLRSTKSTTSKVFRYMKHGGPNVSWDDGLDIERLIDYSIKFPSSVDADNAMPVRVSLQDYRTIALPSGAHLSAAEIDNAREFLSSANERLHDLRLVSGQLQAILEHPERYIDTQKSLESRYRPVFTAVTQQIDSVKKVADECVNAFVRQDEPKVPKLPAPFTIEPTNPDLNPDPAYTIVSALEGGWVIAHDDPSQSQPHVVLHKYVESDPKQRWILKDMGEDKCQLMSGDTKMPMAAGAHLSPNNTSSKDLSQISLRLAHDGKETALLWLVPFPPPEDRPGVIVEVSSGGAAEVPNGEARNGTAVSLAVQSDAARQQWYLLPIGMKPPEAYRANINWIHGGYSGIDSSASPAVVAFRGKFHLFFRDATGSAIYHAIYDDGQQQWKWTNKVGPDCGSGPCPVVFGGRLHLFFRDATGNAIYHVASSDGSSFEWLGSFGMECQGQPSAAVMGDKLCLVFTNGKGNGVMYDIATLSAQK